MRFKFVITTRCNVLYLYVYVYIIFDNVYVHVFISDIILVNILFWEITNILLWEIIK